MLRCLGERKLGVSDEQQGGESAWGCGSWGKNVRGQYRREGPKSCQDLSGLGISF